MTAGSTQPSIIHARSLTRSDYSVYGNVISADADRPFKLTNMGTAQRFNHLSELKNLRPQAELNMCVFRCSPAVLPLEISLLEKHEFSTQIFLPMSSSASYLAIVCLGGSEPDLKTLSAFHVVGPQGISYHPGVWHYPITALGVSIDFACLVYECDTAQDCTIHNFKEPLQITL